MPFIKKTDTKNAQYIIDARKIFIGRSTELQFFKESILKPEDPMYNIVSIDGQGGVGKSTLLLRFIEDAHAPELKDYCLTALVNEREATPTRFMEKFADQLHLEGDFEKALKQYKSVLHKLQNQREAVREALVQKSTTDLIGTAVQAIPFAGDFLKEGVGLASSFLIEEYRYRELLKDAERLEDPIGDLTNAFVRELNRLTETYVTMSSSRLKQRYRVILFFDTFEQLATECAPWLLDYFLEEDLSNNVVLVIAGRDPLEHSTPTDPKRWLPYRDNHTIYSISLNSFSEKETRGYLSERGIIDTERIDMIWHLSRGLPLYLSFLTADPLGKVDPTANVVANFLRWIPEQEPIKRRLALDAALFSRPFNQDELEAFTYISAQERSTLYRWLTAQPFVQGNSQDGRYSYHQLAQELFSRHLYQLSPKECHTSRCALAEYYQRLLKDIESKGGKDVYSSARWLELTLALAKQLFLLSYEESHMKAIEQVINAAVHSDETKEIIRMLRELSQDQSGGQVSIGVLQTVKILSDLMKLFEGDENDKEFLRSEEFLRSVNDLLEKVAHESSFAIELLAIIYSVRGLVNSALEKYGEALTDFSHALELNPEEAECYYFRGLVNSELEKYEEALADFSHALELNPEEAECYVYRGLVNFELEKYEETLTDFSRAIDLNPNDAGFFYRRGLIYFYGLEKYEEALVDFNRAIELNPNEAEYYAFRGIIYFNELKKYEEALADFSWAIELDPNDANYYNRRGDVYVHLEKYEEAHADYNRAIELNPKVPMFYNDRGKANSTLEKYQEALADYSQAIELNPEKAVYYSNRGGAFRQLEKYQEALAGYSQAIELNPNDADFYNQRGNVYSDKLEKYEEALADYSKAIELKPEVAVYYYNRGGVNHQLEKYEEALADYSQALELNPEKAGYYNQRGDVYSSLEKYEEALADYSRALELDPEVAVYYYDRGNIYFAFEKYEEALADISRALELEPEAAGYYNDRSHVYYSLKNYEKALVDINRALELNSEVAHFYNQQGNVYSALKNYEKALADFSRALELNPEEAVYYYNRGDVYSTLKKYEEALADYSRAVELKPEVAVYYSNRGGAYRQFEKYEEALADFGRALELSPNNADSYNQRGNIYYDKLEKYEEALADYSRAIELNPEVAVYHSNRGGAYRQLEKYKEALVDYSRALELNPNNADFYNQRGNIYHDALEKYEEALADYSRAIKLNPQVAVYHSNRAGAYHQLKKDEEALSDYSRVIELDPEEAVYHSNRGRVHLKLKKYEKALADFNRALELDPKMDRAYSRRGLTYLWLRNVKQASADFNSSWELNKTNVYGGWMAEWSRMCQERPEREMISRLIAIIEVDPECYSARVCQGAILWLQEHFEQAKIELEQAILLEQEYWSAYFWLGMVEISLRMDESAIASLEGALEKGLPPILLTPLHWLAQERSDFYEKYIVPLFARHKMFL